MYVRQLYSRFSLLTLAVWMFPSARAGRDRQTNRLLIRSLSDVECAYETMQHEFVAVLWAVLLLDCALMDVGVPSALTTGRLDGLSTRRTLRVNWCDDVYNYQSFNLVLSIVWVLTSKC